MTKSPYPGFTALNRRRGVLIGKKFTVGLTDQENKEFEMLQKVTELMLDYKYPFVLNPDLVEALKQLDQREKAIREGNE